MDVRNVSKKATVARDVEVARGLFRKGLGLMFRGGLAKGSGFLMDFSSEGEGMHAIWMPFMRFRIDVVFISSDMKVTDVHRDVPPVGLHPRTWKVYAPSAPVKWVLELPAGGARAGRIRAGDKLAFLQFKLNALNRKSYMKL